MKAKSFRVWERSQLWHRLIFKSHFATYGHSPQRSFVISPGFMSALRTSAGPSDAPSAAWHWPRRFPGDRPLGEGPVLRNSNPRKNKVWWRGLGFSRIYSMKPWRQVNLTVQRACTFPFSGESQVLFLEGGSQEGGERMSVSVLLPPNPPSVPRRKLLSRAL